MKHHEIVADTPDLLLLAQSDTRYYIASIIIFGFFGTIAAFGLAIYFRAQPWIVVLLPTAVFMALFLGALWLFGGYAVIKVDKATRTVTTLYVKMLPPFERIEYLLPFDTILHAGIYPFADSGGRKSILAMETKEGIIQLVPEPRKADEQILAKIMAIADHLATVDPKASQQGREPGHVVTAVEFAPASEFTGTERGSAGFDDVRQDLLDRIDRLLPALGAGGDARGEGRIAAGQDMLEVIRAEERKILALDLQVSVFATRAHAALLHALVAHIREDDKPVPAMLARARYNLLRA